MSEVLVKVDGVSKKFCRSLKRSLWYGMQDLGSELIGNPHGRGGLRKDEFWAVKDVSFELKRGECLGLIGRNGAGKTTLLRMLNGLIKPDQGRIEMRGRVAALIALGAGFNPILTGRENIYVNASVLGLSKREIEGKFEEIVEFAELGEFIDSPVQSYSSGMSVRLGFSVAAHLDPDVLILDEVLSVGDAQFKIKSLNKMYELLGSCAVVFVHHSMATISRVSNKVLHLDRGDVRYFGGDVAQGFNSYLDRVDAGVGYVEYNKDVCVDKVSIGAIECRGLTEGGAPILYYCDDVVFVVMYRSLGVIGRHQIYINIHNRDVVTVASIRSEVVGSNVAGRYKVSMRVPRIQLSSGDYTITVRVRASQVEGGSWYAIYRNWASFRVVGVANAIEVPFLLESRTEVLGGEE